MTQFIKLDRVTTGTNVPIIFNHDRLLHLAVEGGSTRVTLAAVPEYNFHTLVPPDDILAVVLSKYDVTGGPPYKPAFEEVLGEMPVIYINKIINNDSTNLLPVHCNANFLLFAETVPYLDIATKVQRNATSLVFHSASPARFLTDMSLDDFGVIIDAHQA